jgi:hypothetical protein
LILTLGGKSPPSVSWDTALGGYAYVLINQGSLLFPAIINNPTNVLENGLYTLRIQKDSSLDIRPISWGDMFVWQAGAPQLSAPNQELTLEFRAEYVGLDLKLVQTVPALVVESVLDTESTNLIENQAVANEFLKYVTLAEDETITGQKTFNKDVLMGNIPEYSFTETYDQMEADGDYTYFYTDTARTPDLDFVANLNQFIIDYLNGPDWVTYYTWDIDGVISIWWNGAWM